VKPQHTVERILEGVPNAVAPGEVGGASKREENRTQTSVRAAVFAVVAERLVLAAAAVEELREELVVLQTDRL